MDSLRVEYLLRRIKDHFKIINKCRDLTEPDKQQIKAFYLEHFASPDARRIVERHFPEEFGKAVPKSTPSQTRPHPDRH